MKNFAFALLLVVIMGSVLHGQTTLPATLLDPGGKRILVPDAFGKLVEKHVSRMYQGGYFRQLDSSDLDHGHLIFRAGSPEKFASFEDIFSHVAMVLYHTDEKGFAWSEPESSSPRRRVQRSIVGFPNGQIRPAIQFFSIPYQSLDQYLCCGTIHVSDFGLLNPRRFEQDRDISVSGSETLWFANQFVIYQSDTGRYTVGGIRYDVGFKPEP